MFSIFLLQKIEITSHSFLEFFILKQSYSDSLLYTKYLAMKRSHIIILTRPEPPEASSK